MSSRSNTSAPERPRRRYNSTRRARQAAQTRDDVLVAATARFTASGWAGTTINSIAAEAGVAVETVYSGFGSKKGLLRAAMEVAIVGDAAAVPLIEREEFHRLGRGSLAERVQAGITVQTDIHERSSGVWRTIVEAAAGDPEIDGWRIEVERGRRVDLERAVALILGRQLDALTLDLLWAVFGPEVYVKLTADAGITRAEYEEYLREAFDRLTAPATRRAERSA